MGGEGTIVLGPRRPDPAAKGPPANAAAAPRRPRGQRREQLLAAINAKPGARPSELAGEIGVSPSQVHSLIRKARAEKLIVKKGCAVTSLARIVHQAPVSNANR